MDFLADGLEILPKDGGDPIPFKGEVTHDFPTNEFNGMGIQIMVTALECRLANLNGYALKQGDQIRDTTDNTTYRVDRQPEIKDDWVTAILKA